MRKSLFLTFLLILLSSVQTSAHAKPTSIPGGDAFIEGARLQSAEEWAASLKQFKTASDVYSLVADYALYRMAQSALNLSDKKLAIVNLETLLRDYPDSPVRRRAQIRLGSLYFESEQYARALPLIKGALSGAKWSAEVVSLKLILAKIAYGLDDREQADSICWQLIHNSPASPEAYEAISLLENIDTPEKKVAVAKTLYQNKKVEEALELLDELAAFPEAASLLPEILFYRAQCLAQSGQMDGAAEIYRRIIIEFPQDSITATAYSKLADYHRSKQEFERALLYYAQVVEKFPSLALAPQALWQRGKILENLNDPGEHAEYEKILQDYPRSSVAYFAAMNWGVDLYRIGDYSAARTVFERLVAINAGIDANADALFWIGKCFLALGKKDNARSVLQLLVKESGASYQAYRSRAILRALDQNTRVYQPISTGWETLFAFDTHQLPPVKVKKNKMGDAFCDALSELDEKSLRRLRFLLSHQFPEVKMELEAISQKAPKGEAHYALARVLFQAEAYYDSLRIASSVGAPLADAERDHEIRYLLYPTAYSELIGAIALKYEVDPLLALAVIREESHFQESCVSSSDACGLMQILPKTGRWLAEKKLGTPTFKREDLFQPSVNIELGNYYLRYLLNQFDNNPVLTVAAYNWGETNLRRWMAAAPTEDFDVFVESIPADETRKYVKKVFGSYANYRSLYPPDWFTAWKS